MLIKDLPTKRKELVLFKIQVQDFLCWKELPKAYPTMASAMANVPDKPKALSDGPATRMSTCFVPAPSIRKYAGSPPTGTSHRALRFMSPPGAVTASVKLWVATVFTPLLA